MFEKLSRAAEKAAEGAATSRRGFLGRLGRGALAAAGVVGGLLISANAADAGQPVRCCAGKCKQPSAGCVLVNSCYSNGYGTYCVWSCPGQSLYTYTQCH